MTRRSTAPAALLTAVLLSACQGQAPPANQAVSAAAAATHAPAAATQAPAAAGRGAVRFTRQVIRDPAANNVEAIVFLESAALQRQVTEERMASQDRIAAMRRETLGGVETYRDRVQGALVELPAGWRDYWVNKQGEYLLSDQAGFDPNMGSTRSWERMERTIP